MTLYHIIHITRYTYSTPVIDSANQVMLYPIADDFQKVKKHNLTITNNPPVEMFVDYFGNSVGAFSLIQPHTELIITSEIDIQTIAIVPPPDTFEARMQWDEMRRLNETFPYMEYIFKENFNSLGTVSEMITSFTSFDKTPLQNAIELSAYIYNNFTYKKGVTSVETGLEEIWTMKAGVCQDFAHILLVMLRILGVPARYVSGYICPKNHEMRGEGATHAWVEAYIPFYGWLGLDPTNNCVVSDRHVRLAVGRNFSDCTPVKGTYKGAAEHILEVSVAFNPGGEIELKQEMSATPVFSYKVQNPGTSKNLYRQYLEMQQMQQQQQ